MARVLVRPLQDFLNAETAGAVVLLLATVAALLWANLDSASYDTFWSRELSVGFGDWGFTADLGLIVQDALMTVFFLVVGLEIKRELVIGELRERRAALLPVIAAIGGVVAPALIYLAVNGGGEAANGWGIPVATDIAFAVGAMALVSRRVPRELVVLLLAVAVVDDIIAITIIAIFYSSGVSLLALAVAAAALALMAFARRLHVAWLGTYIVLGLVVWIATLRAGIHPTIAGVAVGLVTPAFPLQPQAAVSAEAKRIAATTTDDPDDPEADDAEWMRLQVLSREAVSPLTRWEHALHPWSSFVALPIFALSFAGVVIDQASIERAVSSTVTLGVILGLVVGKPLGITLAAFLAVRLGVCDLPRGVAWRHMVGMGALAGIGFTVSLFVAGLAFTDQALLDAARGGVLAASIIAATVGLMLLSLGSRRRVLTPLAGPP